MSYILLCDHGGIRTPNQRSRNPLFYPIELRGLPKKFWQM